MSNDLLARDAITSQKREFRRIFRRTSIGSQSRRPSRSSITVVTFAPDEALAAHHELRLVLEAGGMWSAQPIHIERPIT
jgi:hypothetical protein